MKIRILLKIFFSLLVGLLVLEISLQLLATTQGSYATFTHFLSSIPAVISGLDPKKSLFCVGDSTIFGIGASDPLRYSLPGQLESLFKKADPEIACLNLGYPVSSTEEHLQIMSLLPERAMVLYRGGIANDWNREAAFRFSLLGFNFEFKTLKMLVMKLGHFFPVHNDLRSLRIKNELFRLVSEKKLQIFVLDYTTYPLHHCPDPFYLEEGPFQSIGLRQDLSAGGFLREKGEYFKDMFISMTGNHPNDLGYYLEAAVIFNYFCARSFAGLSPKNRTDLSMDAGSEYVFGLQERYRQNRQILSNMNTREQILNFGPENQLFSLLPELWSLAGLLHKLLPEEPLYALEYEALERLAFLVFHDTRIMVIAFSRLQQMFTGKNPQKVLEAERQRFLLTYYAAKAIFPQDSPEWPSIEEKFRTMPGRPEVQSISFLPFLPVYPLEFCPVFLKESGLNSEQLSTVSDWELFFSQSYKETFSEIPAVCQKNGVGGLLDTN
jgi:hypothetical protein